MSNKRLLVYGDVEMDILLKTTPAGPNDHDVKVESIAFSPGGSAANCACVAGSLGLPVTFLGSIGNDSWNKPLLRDFHRFNVNTKYLKHADASTGTCVALVDSGGERKFYSYRGANESSPPDQLPSAVWKRHHCLHLSGYSFQEPNSRAAAWKMLHEAKSRGLLISLDPAYLFAKEAGKDLDELLPLLDFFFPNRTEAALISGNEDPLQAARILKDKGVKMVIVTLGSAGCLALSDGVEQFNKMDVTQPVVDTTGAGDAFCGGFLTGYFNGLSLVQACKLGCASAAHIVMHMGAHEYSPVKADILGIMRQNHEDELAEIIEKSTFIR
jgi:sugar/nucleoside kinase (ribokinase family)